MEENKMEIFKELIRYHPDVLSLPPEKLSPIAFVGREAVKFAKNINKNIDNLKMKKEQRQRWLQDGQEIADIVLDMDVQIGKSLPPPEEAQKQGGFRIDSTHPTLAKKKVLPEGITIQEAYITRQMAKHPDVVEEVKKEARENDDIPTRTAVLNKIKYKRELERKASAPPKTQVELRGEALAYKYKLLKIINILPSEPPKDLTEIEYNELKTLVNIILKRLEVFQWKQEEERKKLQ